VLDIYQSSTYTPPVIEGADPRLAFVDTRVSPGSVLGSPTWLIDNAQDTFRIFRQPNFSTPGITYLAISNSGNVGIGLGTTTQMEGSLLQVNGEILANQGVPSSTPPCTLSGGGYSFVNDYCLDTGMFSPSDGIVALYSNGTNALTVSAANVGIGSAIPQANLDVNGTEKVSGILTVNGELHANNWVQLGTTAPYPQTGTSSGNPSGMNLGVNFNNSVANFVDITGNTPGGWISYAGVDFPGAFWATTSSFVIFPQLATCTPATYPCTVIGFNPTGQAWFASGKVNIDASGNLTATNVSAPSDIRLKKNIRPITDALDKVEQINGVYFDWRTAAERDVGKKMPLEVGAPQVGVIAQDVQKVLPEAVLTDASSGTLAVTATKIIPLLIEAIKEQQKEIRDQGAKIEALEGQLRDKN
jgi:hypothetical protein